MKKKYVLAVSCAFAGYDAARRSIRSLILTHPNFTLNFTDDFGSDSSLKAVVARSFADAFWAEALDCRLQCRHYSPTVHTEAGSSDGLFSFPVVALPLFLVAEDSGSDASNFVPAAAGPCPPGPPELA